MSAIFSCIDSLLRLATSFFPPVLFAIMMPFLAAVLIVKVVKSI